MSASTPPSDRALAIAAAVGTGAQVGAAMVATRFVVGQTGPVTLALLRYIIGFCCVAPAAWMMARHVRFAGRDLVPIALLGIGQFGILIALLNAGLGTVPAGQGAIIFATFPLQTMLLAAVLGQERLSLRKSAGVALSIVGVGLTIGGGAVAGGGTWAGRALVAASAFAGAVCSVFYRPYLRRYPAVAVSAFAMLASVVFLAAFASAGEQLLHGLPALDVAGWQAVLFIGVSSGIGYFLWLYALGHAPATDVTICLSLSPPTAMLLGALALGEPVTPWAAAGLVTVVAGMWLALR